MKKSNKRLLRLSLFAAAAIFTAGVTLINTGDELKEANRQLAIAREWRQSEKGEMLFEMKEALCSAELIAKGEQRTRSLFRAYSAACALESHFTGAGEQAFLNDVKTAVLYGGDIGSLLANADMLCRGELENYPVGASVRTAAGGRLTDEEARERAAKFLGVKAEELSDAGETDGKIPCRSFTYNDSAVFVSKADGRIRLFLSGVAAGEAKIGEEEALERAREFVDEHIFKDAYLCKSVCSAGVCSFSFAPTLEGIPLLDMPVRLSVLTDSGKISFFDGSDYLLNSDVLPDSTQKLSVKEARSAVRGKIYSEEKVYYKSRLCCRFEVQSPLEDGRYYVFVSLADGKVTDTVRQ